MIFLCCFSVKHCFIAKYSHYHSMGSVSRQGLVEHMDAVAIGAGGVFHVFQIHFLDFPIHFCNRTHFKFANTQRKQSTSPKFQVAYQNSLSFQDCQNSICFPHFLCDWETLSSMASIKSNPTHTHNPTPTLTQMDGFYILPDRLGKVRYFIKSITIIYFNVG
jgi:hypothetical protein